MKYIYSDWRVHASCRDTDPDGLFVRGAEQNRRTRASCVAAQAAGGVELA